MITAQMPHAIYLCRHGDTEWSPVRRLAGRTDLPLTEAGEATSREVGKRLASIAFDRVWSSPLQRARRTAELAGYPHITYEPRLVEMDFGRFEGQIIFDIRKEHPGWAYLKHGCPDGETAADLGARADAVLSDLAKHEGTTLIFAHSVILRVLTARYLGLPPDRGRNFMLSPGGVCMLTYDPIEDAPAVEGWNLRR